MFLLQKHRNTNGYFLSLSALGSSSRSRLLIFSAERDESGWLGLNQTLDGQLHMRGAPICEVGSQRQTETMVCAPPSALQVHLSFRDAIRTAHEGGLARRISASPRSDTVDLKVILENRAHGYVSRGYSRVVCGWRQWTNS